MSAKPPTVSPPPADGADHVVDFPWWRRHLSLIIIGALALVVVITVASTASGRAAREEAERQAKVDAFVEAMTPVNVVYQVEGDGTYADLTMATPTGTTQVSAKLPLKNKSNGDLVQSFDRGDFVYLSGQIQNGSWLTCRITVDGKVISENTATGDYAIATCDGTAP